MSSPSHYLSREASEARVRTLGPILARVLLAEIRAGRPGSWTRNRTLSDLASAYLFDPEDDLGLVSIAVRRATA